MSLNVISIDSINKSHAIDQKYRLKDECVSCSISVEKYQLFKKIFKSILETVEKESREGPDEISFNLSALSPGLILTEKERRVFVQALYSKYKIESTELMEMEGFAVLLRAHPTYNHPKISRGEPPLERPPRNDVIEEEPSPIDFSIRLIQQLSDDPKMVIGQLNKHPQSLARVEKEMDDLFEHFIDYLEKAHALIGSSEKLENFVQKIYAVFPHIKNPQDLILEIEPFLNKIFQYPLTALLKLRDESRAFIEELSTHFQSADSNEEKLKICIKLCQHIGTVLENNRELLTGEGRPLVEKLINKIHRTSFLSAILDKWIELFFDILRYLLERKKRSV